MKKNKISKEWINKQRKDIYVKTSKIQGYRSRSAYKLIEIDEKFNLLRNGKFFLDLGAAPGGWSQVASKKIKGGKILSVDIKEIDPINNVTFIKGDFTEERIRKRIVDFFPGKIDLIASDMSTSTTGNKNVDSLKNGELCMIASDFSKNLLKSDGFFVSKIFMGSIFKEIQDCTKKLFKKVIIFKPKSSRKESKEIFIICSHLK